MACGVVGVAWRAEVVDVCGGRGGHGVIVAILGAPAMTSRKMAASVWGAVEVMKYTVYAVVLQ
jgi:hypothetical protein